MQNSQNPSQNKKHNCSVVSLEGLDVPQKNEEFIKNPIQDDVLSSLKKHKSKNVGRVIIGNLNVNSLHHKIDALKLFIPGNIDILVVTETKLDESFPSSQLYINGFKEPYRLDRNNNGGGVAVRDDIPSKLLSKHMFPDDPYGKDNVKGPIEGVFIEINLRKTKWLLFGTYRRPKQNIQYFFRSVSKAIDIYLNIYDNFILTGDFNIEEGDNALEEFMEIYHAGNLIKKKTCFKSLNNPSCVDLIITNSKKSFKYTSTISTGCSDCHKLVLTVLKTKFDKQKSTKIFYHKTKNYVQAEFNEDVCNKLSECKTYTQFNDIYYSTLLEHAPLKQRSVRANQAPYMTRNLRKAIMTRSKLEKRFYKTKSMDDGIAYKRQKNFVSRLYKKERANFYKSIYPKILTDNRNFWKNIKPYFNEKGPNSRKITLVSGNNIISEDTEVAAKFNTFFRESVNALDIEISPYVINYVPYEIDNPVDKVLEKYKYHPSILKIKEMVTNPSIFNFECVDVEEINNLIKKQNPKKASTFRGIPNKFFKESHEAISISIKSLINKSIKDCVFPDELKLADLSPIFKSIDSTDKL